jgi:ubiquitin carboxyl-terminal hydrolase 4/11/15
MYLTLPLPIQKKWKHSVFYVPWDLDKPHLKVINLSPLLYICTIDRMNCQVPVEVNRDASFKDLRQLLGRWMGAVPENVCLSPAPNF